MECKRRKTQGLYWGGPEQRLPTISNWRFDENGGTVSGTVANLWACDAHPKELSTQKGELGAIQEGSQFTTPPVIDPSAVNQYSLIQTESGSWYRLLGEDKPPRISNWRLDKNRGTVSGTVIGDQAIRDGSPFTTSRLKDPSAASQFAIIETESGSEYELLNAADASTRSTSHTEKQGFDYLEQHPELLKEIGHLEKIGRPAERCVAAREAARLPKHISDNLLAEAVRIGKVGKRRTNSKGHIRFIVRNYKPAYAVGRLAEKEAGKFELLHPRDFQDDAYYHENNKIDYLEVHPWGIRSSKKVMGHWPGPFLKKELYRGAMREFRSAGEWGRCFIIEGLFFLWPLVPKGYLCPRRPNNKWHQQEMYTKGEALCYILSLPKQSSQRRILMEFFVQNKLVPVAIASLYKLVKDHESGNQVRGDDWDSNEGPPFQLLTNGIPGSILNGYYKYGATVPKCNKTKKLIRGCAKLDGQKGWKAQLKFSVIPMREWAVSQNPIVYDVAWSRDEFEAGGGFNGRTCLELNFPKNIRERGDFRDVCELFQNQDTVMRAYFEGFVPPGYGNRYSFDKVKEYIICQSFLCGSPVSCVESKDLKSGTQKIFRCTKKCADGAKKCPFGFILKSDFRGYYIDCQSDTCCKWHLCD